MERPKEGETAEIKDTYAYDGSGLRASQTISGTTTYMVWDITEGLPLLLKARVYDPRHSTDPHGGSAGRGTKRSLQLCRRQPTQRGRPLWPQHEDTYAYNDADQISEVKMLKNAEALASLVYTRDNDGQVKGATSTGLPGEEKPAYEYDSNNRLTKGATVAYEYDAANNPTKIGTGTYKYNAANQLETGPSLTYTYDELGERTKTKPSTGPATTYGYDQAGELISVERPKEGETPEIKDTYAYDGNGLRASQTISGTTTYMVWDMTEGLPLLLSDGTNSYIYGPGGLPIEQISSGGTVTYLHHDQQGSTRLLTGSTGSVTGKCTYGAYGTPTCEGSTTTPLGFDGQYTSTDTGLIYMRAREYDPATAQFLTVDPLAGLTLAPYSYVNDNPPNFNDPSGLIFGIPGTPSVSEIAGTAESAVNSTAKALNAAGKAVASVGRYAAPALDVIAAGACIVVSDGICVYVLASNFLAQQALAADQAIYNSDYQLGLNEVAILAGTGLGASALGAVAHSELEALGRAVLGGAVVSPQLLLDLLHTLTPEEAEAALSALGCQ